MTIGRYTLPRLRHAALLGATFLTLASPALLLAQEAAAPAAATTTRGSGGALRPGDMLEVRISGVPSEEVGQFTGTYTVDEQGNVNLPLIGQVRSGGLLANQLQTNIENRLKGEKIYTHPTITILVHNSMRYVNVRGAVRAPSRVPYTPDLTLMTAINAVGGFNEFGGKKVRLIRDGKTREIVIRDIVRDPKKDIAVKPGDQIEALESMGFW